MLIQRGPNKAPLFYCSRRTPQADTTSLLRSRKMETYAQACRRPARLENPINGDDYGFLQARGNRRADAFQVPGMRIEITLFRYPGTDHDNR